MATTLWICLSVPDVPEGQLWWKFCEFFFAFSREVRALEVKSSMAFKLGWLPRLAAVYWEPSGHDLMNGLETHHALLKPTAA